MKHLLVFILICYAFNGNCQIDKPIKKGDMVLGGSSEFAYSKTNSSYEVYDQLSGQYYTLNSDQKSVSISFSPLFGYFIMEGLVIGLSPSYSYSQSKTTSNKGITKTIGIAPFVKYYFNNGFFTGLKLRYSYSTYKNPSLDYKLKYSYLSLNPSIGYSLFINSKVSIEPALEYSFSKNINKGTGGDTYSDTNKFFFSISFNIFL